MLYFGRITLVVRMALMLLLFATTSCLGFSTGFPSSLTSYSRYLNSDSILHLKSDGLTAEERDAKIVKATKAMTAFTNKYLVNTETTLCTELSIPAVVIKGLAEHKVDLGAPLCPCRFYEDKEKEVKDGYWNCPCVPMREEKKCHCMLFLTEDSAFAGDSQVDDIILGHPFICSVTHRFEWRITASGPCLPARQPTKHEPILYQEL